MLCPGAGFGGLSKRKVTNLRACVPNPGETWMKRAQAAVWVFYVLRILLQGNAKYCRLHIYAVQCDWFPGAGNE